MDAKDFRLLVMLNENARQSFHALGRRLSLSAPAVRERLRRLERRGIVQAYWVAMDPAIFGRRDLLVSFDREWSREDALRAAGAPDVAWVAWKVDGGLTVQLWPRQAGGAVEGLAHFVEREPNWHAFTESPWKGNVSGLDWRILDALIDAPLASIGMLSDTTGLSPKTVRNHLAELIRGQAIFVVPRLGLPTDSGVIVYNLVVSGTAPFAQLRHRVGDAVLIHETGGTPPRKYLFGRADSLGELTSTMQALERLPGVSTVQLTLNQEMIIQTDFVHGLVREQMKVARSKTFMYT